MRICNDSLKYVSSYLNSKELCQFSMVCKIWHTSAIKPFKDINALECYLKTRTVVDSDDIELTLRYLHTQNIVDLSPLLPSQQIHKRMVCLFIRSLYGKREKDYSAAYQKVLKEFFSRCTLAHIHAINCKGNLLLGDINVYDIHRELRPYAHNITSLRIQINLEQYHQEVESTLNYAAQHFSSLSRIDVIDFHPKTIRQGSNPHIYSLEITRS